MGKVISFIGTKGGVGKSTLALTISHSKPFQKMKCCIVDADPQGSITSWQSDRQEAKLKSSVEVLSLFYDKALAATLEDLALKYDIIFVDCPGESEAHRRTRTALVMSDVVIIPTKTGEFDMASVIKHILPLIEPARDASAKNTKYLLLPSMIHYAASKDKTIEAFSGTPAEVLNAVFPFRKVYQDFPGNGLTLAEYGKKSNKATKDQVKKALGEIDAIGYELHWHLEKV
jgi:chromosome partitioning protein